MANNYEVGDLVPLGWTINVDGTPTDGTVTLTLTLPNGMTSIPAVTHVSTGRYAASYAATQAGRHVFTWTSTGSVIAAESGSFTIVGSAQDQVVTLAQARQKLNMDDPADTTDDPELISYIDAASDWVRTQVPAEALSRPAVQMATLELIDHLWESQRGPGSGGPFGDSAEFTLGLKGFAIPNRVAEWLAPFASTPKATGSFPAVGRFPDPVDRLVQW